jgi:hypothetical protein
MDLAEAVKKVKAEKIKDNFMILEFSYDNKLILPSQGWDRHHRCAGQC